MTSISRDEIFRILVMGPVPIRHSSHDFGSPVILWISLGGKPKWLPLKFGYHDVMHTSPIVEPNMIG